MDCAGWYLICKPDDRAPYLYLRCWHSMTSRTSEEWLGVAHQPLALGSLHASALHNLTSLITQIDQDMIYARNRICMYSSVYFWF